MHGLKICHRDIKLENIMFSDVESLNIKLIDLGSAHEIRTTLDGTPKKFRDPAGSAYFMAPENILGRYDEQADTWSIGIVMYIMMANELPFDGPNEQAIFDNIRNQAPNLASKLLLYRSIESKDLLKKCLYRMPTTRININDAVHHGFIKRCGVDNVDKNYIRRSLEQFRTFNQTNELQRAVFRYFGKYVIP